MPGQFCVTVVLGVVVTTSIISMLTSTSYIARYARPSHAPVPAPKHTWDNLSDIALAAFDKAIAEGNPILPPFIDLDREYSIAPKYGLSMCKIKKSMSTLMGNVMAGVKDSAKEKNEYNFTSLVDEKFNFTSYKKAVVVRDPITRFVSFFVNKCIHDAKKCPSCKLCYNCRGDILCFLKRQYGRFVRHAFGNKLNVSYEDKHAAPLTWNCEFGTYLKDYRVIKLESDETKRKEGISDLVRFLNGLDVKPDVVDFIFTSALEGDTPHATYDSDSYQIVKKIRSNPTLRYGTT
ncbi:unnamed protein product [Caenorhabditis auriculariae]|uniref:Carbohydrate sulfotransferase n=1 Tax=Caenorhabditis auriculariae TaxID=2777116 RepID=A0A8S1HHB2_9PELO|nr:unnamed protein product [Caenorhabditis auriculariae]